MTHGKISESILEKACFNIFGEDFTFKSPNVINASGKCEELTDVLIILGKYLITIQSKSIALTTQELNEIKYGRIVKKYDEAKRQINRTINAYNRKEKVLLNTCFNKELVLPWENINEIIGIITINIDDLEYTDCEYRFQFPLKVEKHKNITLHTFILRDFFTLIQELTTGGDFINYLLERYYLSTKILQNYTNELDIVALFASQYHVIEEIRQNKYDKIVIEPGIWENYLNTHKDKIIERNNKKFKITIIDLIIQELRSSIDYTMKEENLSIEEMIKRYFFLIGIFGLLNSIEVYQINEIFRDKLLSSDKKFFRYFIFPTADTALFFFISNEEDREKRKSSLLGFTGQVAKYISSNPEFHRLKYILSTATEGKKVDGRSIDFVYTQTNEALSFVNSNEDIKLFEKKDYGRVDQWTM